MCMFFGGGENMNEEFILSLIKGKIKNGQLMCQDFKSLFSILSNEKQYEVRNLLTKKGIILVDTFEDDAEECINDELLNSEEISDSDLFKDSYDFFRSNDLNDSIDRTIKQSNEMLCVFIQQGDERAKSDLCLKNKRLVAKYAYHYKGFFGCKLSFDDLMQEGYIGLLKAAKNFDISLDNSFSTYAVYWIKQSITRAIMDSGFMIRIPAHVMEKIYKITRLDSMYKVYNLNREQRREKIANDLNIDIEYIKLYIQYRNIYLNVSSLDIPVGEDENVKILDFIEDKNMLSVEEYFYEHLLKDEINRVLGGLTNREEKVIRLRFGLFDGRTHTLEEIGEEFHVTRERIRQIEAKALRKLKNPIRSKHLKCFIDNS